MTVAIGDEVKASDNVEKQRRAHCVGTVVFIADDKTSVELKQHDGGRMRVRLKDICPAGSASKKRLPHNHPVRSHDARKDVETR